MLVELALTALLNTEKPAFTDAAMDYRPDGRRDPFVSLIKPFEGPRNTGCTPRLPGFLTAELTLRGTVASNGGFIALLVAPDGKAYFARVGQPLYDGRVVEILQGAVTVQQDVFDNPGIIGAKKTGSRLVKIDLPD